MNSHDLEFATRVLNFQAIDAPRGHHARNGACRSRPNSGLIVNKAEAGSIPMRGAHHAAGQPIMTGGESSARRGPSEVVSSLSQLTNPAVAFAFSYQSRIGGPCVQLLHPRPMT